MTRRRNTLLANKSPDRESVLAPVTAAADAASNGSNGPIPPIPTRSAPPEPVVSEAPRRDPHTTRPVDPINARSVELDDSIADETLAVGEGASAGSTPGGTKRKKFPIDFTRTPEMLEQLRNASVFLGTPINHIGVHALERELERLRLEYNDGEPFPTRIEDPRVGRRVSRVA